MSPVQTSSTEQPRSLEIVKEREALEELIGSRGFQIFLRHAYHEWRGEGFHARMTVAFGKPDGVEPRVMHKASLEILRLLQWPRDRVTELKGHVE
jgi:hypothetical protein